MEINKFLTYALLALITLMPWNATAINTYGFGHLLPKPKFAHLSNLSNTLAESLLIKGLLEITQGKNQQALDTIDKLLVSTPNFKLANLVRGDLLMAQGRSLQGFGSAETNQTEAVKDLQDEARVRIERYLSNKDTEKLPSLLIAPNDKQSHVMVVDTDKSRLYLYKNDQDKLTYVADYYITVGKNGLGKQAQGDKRTPIGVYFLGKKLTQPLADIYGEAAYPLNYPNEWDSQHNKNGSGIWLHGTPSNTYSRPPRASDGCVVLTNQDLKTLEPILQAGNIPLIIASNLKWLNTENSAERQSLQTALDQWLNDWRSQNTSQYLSHYSRDFFSSDMSYPKWAEHKTKVQSSKPKVEIDISEVSMFAYPDSASKMVVVDFLQNFSSPALSNKMLKRQYWIFENDG